MLDREEIEGQELYLKEQNFIRFSIPGRPDAAGENQKLQITEMKLRGQEATDRYVGMELQIKMTGSDVWTMLTWIYKISHSSPPSEVLIHVYFLQLNSCEIDNGL